MEISTGLWDEARAAAEPLKAELEELILGSKKGPFGCSCGAHQHGDSEAISIRPAGREARYASQVPDWFVWTVQMRDDDSKLPEGDYDYSCGLSGFLETPEIERLFADAFGDIPARIAVEIGRSAA